MMTSQVVAVLLAVAVVPSNGSDWGRVQQLRAGTRIVVTARGRGTRLAELSEFMPTISRGGIAEISRPAKGASGAIVGAAVAGGIALGLTAMTSFLFAPCNGGCGSNVVMAVAGGASIPVAAGFLAAQATRRKAEVIYQGSPEPGGAR